ncbi:RWD domain-containing protein 4-like [Topomyia yanbarensis]|uniref:RWD domain-containing protein 4-like n=1 Tax=Topomyia yanbarensis TaxID=2498891 RepID=UPI00273B84A1|nr:RWD domain-containing protein 4-like [Topomyia yanbarensis]XP_058819691.1 RWD domain-containing protein 4-like [Topomyia yanbarensis]
MSETKELQTEEREALTSIYEGDNSFKQISAETFQYKYGEEGGKSFLLEICWHETYPNELPTINMDTFYNQNVSRSVKDKIIGILKEEGEQWLGCGMTYTLFECLKDKVDELLMDENFNCGADQQIIGTNHQQCAELGSSDEADPDERGTSAGGTGGGGGNQKKEQLTKAQKRKQWDRVDNKGNRPRGWDWVDIVKHLSQTGGKVE